MYSHVTIKGKGINNYEQKYDFLVSDILEENLIRIISQKYDLEDSITIETFVFLSKVVVVTDCDGYHYTVSYAELAAE